MLIAHTADSHLSASDPHATLEEQVQWLIWIGQDAARAGATVLLHGGDLYEAASTPAERQAAAEVLSCWAELMTVLLVRGNHDRELDLHLLGRLRTRHGVHVLEQPGVVRLPGLDVACMPWPRRAQLAALTGATSRLELGQAAAAGLRAILDGFGAGWRTDAARVLLAHAEIGGALLDSGQPLVAHCDVPLSEVDLLATGADYIALGHIHRSQTLQGRIRYPGSPRPTAFGQDDDPKGYSLVEVALDKAPPVITHRVSPARRLVTIEAVFDPESGHLSLDGNAPGAEPPVAPGADVRIVFGVREDNRARAAADAQRYEERLFEGGVRSVKVDMRIATTHRVRSEEIRTARTTADRVRAWWTTRGGEPARAAHILSKLATLEAA